MAKPITSLATLPPWRRAGGSQDNVRVRVSFPLDPEELAVAVTPAERP